MAVQLSLFVRKNKAHGLAHKYAGVGQIGHTVHVLAGVETVADFVLIRLQMLRQRSKQQRAVHG